MRSIRQWGMPCSGKRSLPDLHDSKLRMPFTFAHPAAAVPLYRLAPNRLVLSALVIGSMTPDFHYFLPFDIVRSDSHSVAALLWFCLPLGMALYLLFHLVLKAPLTVLLPDAIRTRLPLKDLLRLPSTSGLAIAVSLLLGAVTHLVWDGFTHGTGFGVQHFPLLATPLFAIGDHHVTIYKVLQHGSTLLGGGLLAWWCRVWYKSALPQTKTMPAVFSRRQRLCILWGMVAVPSFVGLLMAMSEARYAYRAYPLQDFASDVVITAISTFHFLLVAYGLLWQINRRYLRET